MKYLFVNSVFGVKSTGKLILKKCNELQSQGHICVAAYGRETAEDVGVETWEIGGTRNYLFHAAWSRLLDCQGFMSKYATKRFLERAEEYSPDVVWLHNLHGYYLNVEMLFSWLKLHPQIQVYWTLHDCWPFTGHCAHFVMAGCQKWKIECKHCPQKKEYPASLLLDRSKSNYAKKKNAFTGIENMTIIVPSKWLAGVVKDSFLGEYEIEVQPNTIDTDLFRPCDSEFRNQYGLNEKYIVLGVAARWDHTKGYQDMLALRKLLDDRYVMVMVGVDQKQMSGLPEGIIGIPYTKTQQELVEIYSAADVFVNPTHQDNYPTVNLEARACHTPVITYDVGGSPESAGFEHIIEEGDIQGIAERIKSLLMDNKSL